MSGFDRHATINSGWFAGPAIGLVMMAAPQYFGFSREVAGICFWAGIALFLCSSLFVLTLWKKERYSREKVLGPAITIGVGIIIACIGAAWLFWPSPPKPIQAPMADAQPKIVADKARLPSNENDQEPPLHTNGADRNSSAHSDAETSTNLNKGRSRTANSIVSSNPRNKELASNLKNLARKLIVLEQTYYLERNKALSRVGYNDEEAQVILRRAETAEEKQKRLASNDVSRRYVFSKITQKYNDMYENGYRSEELSLRTEAYNRLFLTLANMPQSCVVIEDRDKFPGNWLSGGDAMEERAACLLDLSRLIGEAKDE
jgi:hypothetical protein